MRPTRGAAAWRTHQLPAPASGLRLFFRDPLLCTAAARDRTSTTSVLNQTGFHVRPQDFKTAHLLGVAPSSQLVAMLLGSAASVPLSVAAYQLYTSAWQVRGRRFTAHTNPKNCGVVHATC